MARATLLPCAVWHQVASIRENWFIIECLSTANDAQPTDCRRSGNARRAGDVSRAADADDETGPDAPLQADHHGFRLGGLHAADEYGDFLGHLRARCAARYRDAISV